MSGSTAAARIFVFIASGEAISCSIVVSDNTIKPGQPVELVVGLIRIAHGNNQQLLLAAMDMVIGGGIAWYLLVLGRILSTLARRAMAELVVGQHMPWNLLLLVGLLSRLPTLNKW
ncbi:unnamed protein product [Linum trigynum]|uniref:Uncharacterized protein n=1 Tax=Linum trigynum TaxID=586398 RepID=A0AAV2DV12_9ROSI